MLDEHRAVARLTRFDVDDLDVFAGILADLHGAAVDHDLDQAAALLGVLLSLLPSRHVLVVAARAGLDVGDLRRAHRAVMVESSHAVSAALDWTRQAGEPSHLELQRRRWPPTGDRDLWVKYGPDGPPLPDTSKEAG